MIKIAQAFPTSQPQPLTPEAAARHRFDWAGRLDINDLNRTLSSFPGRSSWIPELDEVLIVGPWRNRDDIAAVAQISAVRRLDDLIATSREASFQLGAQAFVMPEWNETRNRHFYERNGLDLLEDVISYEVDAGISRSDELRIDSPLRLIAADSPLFGQIVAIDHAAFPWLWRNSHLEFEHYLFTPGVEIWALRNQSGATVSYAGITSYAGWGHLDRVAVDPAWQGRGYGERTVRFAIARLRQLGARRVGLSTQRSNVRSQRLYARIGFQQTWQNDYRIYGTLAPGAPTDEPLDSDGFDRR
ncbi:MAG TPA: GNAT family N-acetyltransferase [Thermomicrobiales bacterium]|nr:GNAT family N-acetyltransferase [Thermomicrobiales bacterium]